jgi:tRNA (Thr-GGU) A37 N-methylase
MRIGVVAHKSPPAEEREVIRVDDDMLQAISGLEAFSHWIVVFQTEIAPPAPGACATRHRARPSGLGVAVVEYLRRDDELLYVSGLHARVGDVVLDLQPYVPERDAAPLAVTTKQSPFEPE